MVVKYSWDIELKPGKPFCFRLHDDDDRKLVFTRATLAEGLGKEKTVVLQYVNGDDKSPVELCSLVPNEKEICSLSLEFEHGSFEFTVIGDRGIHLSGYTQPTFVHEGDREDEEEEEEEEEEEAKSSRGKKKLLPLKFRDRDRPPRFYERRRLWNTLSREELEETLKKH